MSVPRSYAEAVFQLTYNTDSIVVAEINADKITCRAVVLEDMRSPDEKLAHAEALIAELADAVARMRSEGYGPY